MNAKKSSSPLNLSVHGPAVESPVSQRAPAVEAAIWQAGDAPSGGGTARPGSGARTTSTGGSDRESQPPSVPMPFSQVSAVDLPVALGEIVAGKYQVLGVIGTGGMGHVVSALHIELGERVALKFLRREALENKELMARFATEARAAAKIRSEHVARVFDVGTLPNGTPFIVMEYLQGTDLAELLRVQGRLSIPTAVGYVLQACEALASAHSAGIVHRDIKPDNLFLTRHPQGVDIVKVLDFGISKVALTSLPSEAEQEFVRTMFPLGSPSYMSPEQIRDSADVDSRTDIWSLGCVLFRLLTGAHAFDAPTLVQLGAVILEREPVPLRQFVPSAPPELEFIVRRCLEKDPNQRWQNVSQLAQALVPFAPRIGRMAADRCSFLLPGAEAAVGPLEHSERPSDLPSVLVSSIRPSESASDVYPELAGLRSRFGVTQVLAVACVAAVIALAYSLGRSSNLATEASVKDASGEVARSARGAVGSMAMDATAKKVKASLPSGSDADAAAQAATDVSPALPEPAVTPPPAAATALAETAVNVPATAPLGTAAAVVAPVVARAPGVPAAKPSAPNPAIKRATAQPRRRYGRTRDEEFDVGY